MNQLIRLWMRRGIRILRDRLENLVLTIKSRPFEVGPFLISLIVLSRLLMPAGESYQPVKLAMAEDRLYATESGRIISFKPEKRARPMPKRRKAPVENRDFTDLYQSAAERFGVPWQLLKAVHYIESGGRGDSDVRSRAGATGPMQFMADTWRRYGFDANNDGQKDITSVEDSVFGAANYLAENGASADKIDQALYRYNRSVSYVAKVKEIADSIEPL